MEYAAEKGILYQREPRNLASGYKRPVNKLQFTLRFATRSSFQRSRNRSVLVSTPKDLESWVGLAQAYHERAR